MISNEKKINNLFFYWLVVSLILVFFIIIIGGLTRLTNSGLSITEWELIKGILPPLNRDQWEIYFEAYKMIPQYKLINPNMSLTEFKIIFYWEYFHRIIARVLGIFFFIPLLYFYFSKSIKAEYMNVCYLIFSLIVLQGTIGWYMVKSGLINDVTVSHYRLSIHLTAAVLIISSIFWLLKNIKLSTNKKFFKISNKNTLFQILIFLIFIQIIMGAFVSGLDAGQIYQTWPKMGFKFFPDDIILNNSFDLFNFNNHSLVQFYHRTLAYIIIIYTLFLAAYIFKNKISDLYKPFKIMIFFIFIQITLGIYTLISGLNIYLASAHQISSILLVFSALNLYYIRVK
jgi:cytochrome c oxidase assembly protein subunit 15